ncbi:hypothetical protein FTX61_15145 [Nitriliruptoraceae bacterium ZYF776]|nr:hypothetical protein [Profundirhabdus halotolerans]
MLHRRAHLRRTALVPTLVLLLWAAFGLVATSTASAQVDDGTDAVEDGADDGLLDGIDADGTDADGTDVDGTDVDGTDVDGTDADAGDGQLDDLGGEGPDGADDDAGVLDEDDTLEDDPFGDGGADELGDDGLEGDTLGGDLDDPPAPVGGVDAGFGGAAGDGTLPWTAAAAALLALTFALWTAAQRRIT